MADAGPPPQGGTGFNFQDDINIDLESERQRKDQDDSDSDASVDDEGDTQETQTQLRTQNILILPKIPRDMRKLLSVPSRRAEDESVLLRTQLLNTIGLARTAQSDLAR